MLQFYKKTYIIDYLTHSHYSLPLFKKGIPFDHVVMKPVQKNGESFKSFT